MPFLYEHIPAPIGMNTRSDPFQLSEEEAIEIKNLRPHAGVRRLEPVGGRAAYNATEIVNTNGIQNVYQFEKEDGTKYLVVGTRGIDGPNPARVYGSTTNSFVGAWFDNLALSETYSFATFKNRLYIAHQFDSLRGTTGTTHYTVGTKIPTVSPVPVSAGSIGRQSSGWYKYALGYVYDGYQKTKRGPWGKYEREVGDGGTKVTIPSGAVSGDSRVTNIIIYRTKAGGDVFFEIARVSNQAQDYVDTKGDDELTIEYNDDRVGLPRGQFVLATGDRLWLFNTKSSILPTPTDTNVTLVQASSGSMSVQSYTYKFVFVSYEGAPKDGLVGLVRSAPSAGKSIAVDLPNASVEIQNPPIPDDPSVVAMEIYRSSTAVPTFKLALTISRDGWESGFAITDTLADASLGETMSGTATEVTEQSKFVWTAAGETDATQALNFEYVERGRGIITGAKVVNGNIVVFKEDSIHLVVLSSDPDAPVASIVSISDKLGCIAPNSIIQVEDVLYFMSRQGFYSLSGNALEYLSEDIEPDIQSLLSNETNRKMVATGFLPRYREVWVVDTAGGIRWVLQLSSKRWFKIVFKGGADNDIRSLYSASDGTLYSGAFDSGWIYKEDTGSMVEFGLSIGYFTTTLKARWISLGGPVHDKRIREIVFALRNRDAGEIVNNVVIKTYFDRSGTVSETKNFTFSGNQGLGIIKFIPNPATGTWLRFDLTNTTEAAVDFYYANLKYRVSHPERIVTKAITG